jgi:hypothetical protein
MFTLSLLEAQRPAVDALSEHSKGAVSRIYRKGRIATALLYVIVRSL